MFVVAKVKFINNCLVRKCSNYFIIATYEMARYKLTYYSKELKTTKESNFAKKKKNDQQSRRISILPKDSKLPRAQWGLYASNCFSITLTIHSPLPHFVLCRLTPNN